MEEEKNQDNVDWRRRHHRARPFMVIALIFGIFLIIGLVVAANSIGMAMEHGKCVGNFERGGNRSLVSGIFGNRKMGTIGHRGNLGSVSAINDNTITLHASSGDTNVNIETTTSIYKNGVIAKQSDLKIGDVVTVIGAPDSDGVIAAQSILIN
jgi:hypothetical protein